MLGYPFISVVMYAVHASIVLPRSRLTPLKSMGNGRLETGDSQILFTGSMTSLPNTISKEFVEAQDVENYTY